MADFERIERIRTIAHQLIDEIEYFEILKTGWILGPLKARPKPELAAEFHRRLDGMILLLRSAAASWSPGTAHQGDELEAAGLVNQIVAGSLPDSWTPRVKFRRFEFLLARAKADEWVPSVRDQLAGSKPVPGGKFN